MFLICSFVNGTRYVPLGHMIQRAVGDVRMPKLATQFFQGVLTVAWRLLENAMIGWDDDQIGAFFGIHSPSLSTVVAWGLPFILAAVTLWIFHHYSTDPLKKALAQQSTGDRFSATGVVYGPSPRTWIQRVEPHHIIILGLLISGAGLVWLMLKGEDPIWTGSMRTPRPGAPI
jgi:hypothetical protein